MVPAQRMTRTNRESITFFLSCVQFHETSPPDWHILAPRHTHGESDARFLPYERMRPYSGESTPSRPIWAVKHRQAWPVLR